jgi:dihydrofolate reductase
MRKIIVLSMISLDGVMQGPGGPQEDTTDGFKLGGWVSSYFDDEFNNVLKKQLEPADYLFGRKTFDIFESYWPHHNDYWPGVNSGAKYVLSKSRNKSDWKNTTFLKNVADIEKVKKSDGPDLQIHGSGELVKLLLKNDMVDEFWLKTYPIILGKGKKLFDDAAIPAAFTLTESTITPSGVVIANYSKAGKVKTGQVEV